MKTGPVAGLSAATISLALLSGCMQLGPASICRDRFDYGEWWKQPAPLNIVKMSCARHLFSLAQRQCRRAAAACWRSNTARAPQDAMH
jgi:hypothetical protein